MEKKGDEKDAKGGTPSQTPFGEDSSAVDQDWEENGPPTPVRSSRATQELLNQAGATMPPPPEEAPAQDVLRSFMLESKNEITAIEEATMDYLNFCKTSEAGKEELYKGLVELRELIKTVKDRKDKAQYLYSYSKLIEHLGPGDPNFWTEIDEVGQLLQSPDLSSRAKDVFTSIFVNLAESLWKELPAVALELKKTFDLLRTIYQNDSISPDLRGRAMTIFAEFDSFVEK